MHFFNILSLVIFISLTNPLYASGTKAGSGGKSAGQVGETSSNFHGEIDGLRANSLNELKGQSTDFDHEHVLFSQILKQSVRTSADGLSSLLNYSGVDKSKLSLYIESSLSLKKREVDSWKRENQLAYYFNLYNALTIDLILKNFPVSSIKELGSGFPFFQSPWKKKFFKLFGELSYLDHIEHGLVRANSKLEDPLVHFAFNCASFGCPSLSKEAFVGSKLNEQLIKVTKIFLKDRTRNFLKGNILYLSSIFKWYQEDFSKGLRGFKSLKGFVEYFKKDIARNSQEEMLLKNAKYQIEFLDYDWNLNNTSI